MMGAKALSIIIENMYFESRESWVMTVCRRCRVIHSGESMPEIISVYSYVGRGGGDVLTSSVNELYLSVGFIRGFFLLPSVPSLLFLSLSLYTPLFSSQLVLAPRHLSLLTILSSLWQTRIREIHEIRTFQIGAFNLLGPRNYSWARWKASPRRVVMVLRCRAYLLKYSRCARHAHAKIRVCNLVRQN